MHNIRYLLMYEGSAEQAICDILIENDLLHFPREQLIFEEGIRGLTYERIKSRLGFSVYIDSIDTVRLYRVKDRKNIPFRTGIVHKELLKGPVDVLTRPEIEMLYIISEGRFDEYTKHYNRNHIQPCDYLWDIIRSNYDENYVWKD